ncbi:MAG: PAS domain S-box protein, partial [Bacteroidales bacterium]|nr:PAS domain S-box protein [Bacteroidales bacterium]
MSNNLLQPVSDPHANLAGYAGKLLDDISLWVQIIDSEGQVVFTNRYAERLSGFNAQEFATEDLLWEELFDDELKGLRLKNICLHLLIESRGFSNKMIEIVTRAGATRRLLLSMDNLSLGGITNHPVAILIGSDYSFETNLLEDLRNSEQRYRNLFLNAPLGFFRSLPEGQFLEVNETLAHMLGFANAGEVLKQIKNIEEQVYITPDKRRNILAEVNHSPGIVSFETLFKNRQGNPFNGRINVCARFDSEFGQWILEGTLEDITERIKIERELHENMLKFAKMFENSPAAMWEIDYAQVKIILDHLKKSHPNL